MLPFYYLSVTTNLIMGLILVFSNKNTEEYNVKYPFLKDPTFLLVLFIFAGISAVLKLLSPVPGSIGFIGDMLPAISGGLGCIAFFDRWIKASESQQILLSFFEKLLEFEQFIGFFCLIAGTAHLLFSQAVLL